MKKYGLGFVVLSLVFSFSVHASESVENPDVKVVQVGSGPSVIPLNGVRIPFLQFRVTAEKDLKITEITLQQKGLSSSDDVEDVYIESRYGRSNRGNVDNDGVARIGFRDEYQMKQGEAHVMTVYANISGRRGITIGFDLLNIQTEPIEITESSLILGNARTIRPSWASRRQSLIPRQRTTYKTSSQTSYSPKLSDQSRRYTGSFRSFRNSSQR